MRAFEDCVFEWLRDDANVRRCGYAVKSTNASSIRAYTLVVDGECSCKVDDMSIRLVDACLRGPWMTAIRKTFEAPHLMAMEVQMNGSRTCGAWHVDSSDFQILTVVVPLNEAYHVDRGGCTEVCGEDGTKQLQCNANEFAVFDGSRLHRRTAAVSSEWAARRRVVFMHFTVGVRKWASITAARSVHTRQKNARRRGLQSGLSKQGAPMRMMTRSRSKAVDARETKDIERDFFYPVAL